MSALAAKSAASGVCFRRGVARTALPMPVQKRVVRVRAEPESSTSSSEDVAQKLQAQATEALKFVQGKWDSTDNSEKPAALAIILGVVVAQIAIGATIDAVDRIPVINKGLQLIGVAVTALFFYRYFTDPSERESVKKSVDAFVKSVTGEK
ncbi:hypothetical protein VOLCADRAFT_106454 [Volvox carteri f. nagariensis]|uniref:Cyanobacterial aminoacyl-tRNA synthetase CAAD domain-containing protein n=1 Tax=Volvox carteri f. nagariensis TaxID=3068 RepID=D8U7I0_VOLCA|nr:uncharacterized protein VOLCADRAFT_106454 [Volvox carteri f. nagariensis]EFJ44302.1 hypothetical protein VOLCADRAFT_106454 [Volvox carteri f. nagariensis]|eukprot:XP_002954661.1 hypothetical protein VOLCADRAFT_106454 [Volvox carteri f. nagariensis]